MICDRDVIKVFLQLYGCIIFLLSHSLILPAYDRHVYWTQHVVTETQAGPLRKASASYARCSAKHLGKRDGGLFTRKSVKQYWERVVCSNLASPSGFSLTNTPRRLFSSFRLLLGKFLSSIETRAFQLNESYHIPQFSGGDFISGIQQQRLER